MYKIVCVYYLLHRLMRLKEDNKTANRSLSHKFSAIGLLIAVGIVFGDIGTSPLYVMKAIVGVNAGYSEDYIIGAVSCIIWTLTLQTTVKYVLIALRADNKGEGGILALYSLLKRSCPRWLYIVAALGVGTLIADGVITPAITVTSAIEGIRSFDPSVPTMPIIICIILVVFVVQQFGTGKIGRYFGPFMLVWFLMLGAIGAVNIGLYAGVMNAFNPIYAIRLLVDYPDWFLILGAVFLCTTGAEALYSDLGHCGRMNISISWIFVKAMLILTYLGQGAWLIANKGNDLANVNPFYAVVPHALIVPAVVMATGAAIIASQALISGSFTIFSEAIGLNFWPRLRIKYPSTLKGQLYIPAVNVALCAGCLLTVALFQSSERMEAAYGLAITVTMLMTTVLLVFYLNMRNTPKLLTLLFVVVFTAIEGCFFVANAHKFSHGGWYTLLIGGVVFMVIMIWHSAELIRNRFIEYKRVSDYYPIITDIKDDVAIPKYASNLIYVSHSGRSSMVESKVLYSIINKRPKRADHYWLLHLEITNDPDQLEYDFDTLIPETLFRVNLKIGFRIRPQLSVYLRQIVEDRVRAGKLDLVSTYPSLRRHGVPGDFHFVIIHRIFSPESTCSWKDRTVMRLRDIVRHLGIPDTVAFGLDTSYVTVENVPLIITTHHPRRIRPSADG